jgi:hypothetical protein
MMIIFLFFPFWDFLLHFVLVNVTIVTRKSLVEVLFSMVLPMCIYYFYVFYKKL